MSFNPTPEEIKEYKAVAAEVVTLAKEFLPVVKDGLGVYLEALTDNKAFRKAVVVGMAGQIAKGIYQSGQFEQDNREDATHVAAHAYWAAKEILRLADADFK